MSNRSKFYQFFEIFLLIKIETLEKLFKFKKVHKVCCTVFQIVFCKKKLTSKHQNHEINLLSEHFLADQSNKKKLFLLMFDAFSYPNSK
ncbi:hypothetical protein BpHYR1_017744 [Brachionus plicatilis]|uniref:Uncharacterized protein n=1 Tax=Brachionus plicatilis TaxID=10195 RepID=A0A3M7S6B7_BRAPC|nr:hypothetical protein BpHYR1_017744 [Brachionus plicatilis]